MQGNTHKKYYLLIFLSLMTTVIGNQVGTDPFSSSNQYSIAFEGSGNSTNRTFSNGILINESSYMNNLCDVYEGA